jgi:hypothetical protein
MNYGIISLILRRHSCKITDWESLGGKWPDNSGLIVVVNTDGRIEVFMVGNDKVLYHIWQTKPGGSWV